MRVVIAERTLPKARRRERLDILAGMGRANHLTLSIFGPVLVITGVLGLIGPSPWDLMSTAAPYDLMHIGFGLLGTALAWSKRPEAIRAFNIGFGAFDLYQLLASLLGWFPIAHFQWHVGDDVLHAVLGAALVAVGLSRR